MSLKVNRIVVGLLLSLATLGAPTLAAVAQSVPAQASGAAERLIVVARSDGEYDALRIEVERAGGSIVRDMREGGMLVATGASGLKTRVQVIDHAKAVAEDEILSLIEPGAAVDMSNAAGARVRTELDSATSAAVAAARHREDRRIGDPGVFTPGLLWNLVRIHAPQAWEITTGSPAVRVGVADTGLDFTHSELGPRIADVVDFTVNENPPICKTFFANPIDPTKPGIGDADLAAMFHGPEKTDWNGHGSWIGGNIAATLDGQGINGIAPNVKLVSLKISQWCGSAFSSTIMAAFLFAGNHNIDIVSISFGGYLNKANPNSAILWQQYADTVQRVRGMGTLIVAAAGNEHLQIGPAGVVLSHGPTVTPGSTSFVDRFGQFETPGGLPGVVDVSSTGNVVAPSTRTCVLDPANPSNFNVCKPTADAHQQAGVGRKNQLAYYSNYGSRIDVAGPGGARKFNLPFYDNGGTPGFPYTNADFTNVFEAFSTTSNWAIQIPCFTFTGGGFPAGQCYTAIQGTSMATPHASGVAALIASTDADARHNPNTLESALEASARHITGNRTQVLSATDKSPDDQTGKHPCVTGYCHLGGPAISDKFAYGAGLVDAQRAVRRESGDQEGDQSEEN